MKSFYVLKYFIKKKRDKICEKSFWFGLILKVRKRRALYASRDENKSSLKFLDIQQLSTNLN